MRQGSHCSYHCGRLGSKPTNELGEMVKTYLSNYPTREARKLGHLCTDSDLNGEGRGTLASQPIQGQSRRPEKALTRVRKHRGRQPEVGKKTHIGAKAGT